MLTMVHSNPAQIVDGRLIVDRKFLSGMELYSHNIPSRILTINPEKHEGRQIMDPIDVSLSDLRFEVMVVKTNHNGKALVGEEKRLRAAIASSELVYGAGFNSASICREYGVRQVLILEYDLRTQLVATTSEVTSPIRKLSRILNCFLSYIQSVPHLSGAVRLHCNGYPIYLETARFNPKRLLYLDSRMSRQEVISNAELQARLLGRSGRPLRLLFSGRYEPMKGALDAVKVAVACLDRGLDIEMDCYGQGSQITAMRRLAVQAGRGRISIHDSIPYPELINKSRSFDIFVCCHIQSDPSCTYLESFGAGLPIVGYDNRMWRHLQQDSKTGFYSPTSRPQGVVDAIAQYAMNADLLATHSARARAFALEHCFEAEFLKRTEDINALLNIAHACQ